VISTLGGAEVNDMSLVISVYVREGIVMAADSRLTFTRQDQQGGSTIVSLAVGQSDSNYKLFLAPNGIGLSTYGAADINGVPIAGYVESFIADKLRDTPASVEEVVNRLAAHFCAFAPVPNTQFHVAGYSASTDEPEQQVWHVDLTSNKTSRLNPPGQQGASWGGEADILARLVQPVAQVDQQDKIQQKFPYHQIPWQFFTLQDAIDFAVFAIRSTIDALRFQPRAKTVGGPIDVLVIKPTGASWIQRKELRVER
jgi:hypothetical protein